MIVEQHHLCPLLYVPGNTVYALISDKTGKRNLYKKIRNTWYFGASLSTAASNWARELLRPSLPLSIGRVNSFDKKKNTRSSFCKSINKSIPTRRPLTRNPNAFTCTNITRLSFWSTKKEQNQENCRVLILFDKYMYLRVVKSLAIPKDK